MFQRFRNAWELLGSSLHVLSHDKELLIFPAVSSISLVAVLASFAGGAWGLGFDFEQMRQLYDSEQSLFRVENIPALLVLFGFYFVNYLVITYFNAALIGAAYIRLNGGDPTVADGFTAANRVLPAIVGYAAIAATVGLILKLVRERSDNFIARIVISLVGMAWSLVVFLVVPVLVIERVGPVTALKRSASLLRNSWGEQIISNIGFGLISMLFTMLGFAFLALGIFLYAQDIGGMPLLVVFVTITIVYWLLLSVIISALRGIFVAALYGYATDRPVQMMPRDMLQNAFSPRY